MVKIICGDISLDSNFFTFRHDAKNFIRELCNGDKDRSNLSLNCK